MKTAILIPCYNEELSISQVVRDFKVAMPEASIYVYDNNSTDQTAENALKAGAIVRHEYRQGKGNVIRQMLRDIEADCYLLVDGDNTYPAESARQLCQPIEEGFDMVIGDRLSSTYFKENKRLFHNTGNKVVRYMINKIFQANLHDIMTGYRALSRNFAKNLPILSCGFEIETEMTIYALDKHYTFKEIPINYRDRSVGSTSKLNTISDGIKVIGTILQMFRDYKPLRFFSIISLCLFLIATILFVPVFIEYLNIGLVPRYPTLIVSGFIYLAALLTFFCGIILDVVAKKHNQIFEIIIKRNT